MQRLPQTLPAPHGFLLGLIRQGFVPWPPQQTGGWESKCFPGHVPPAALLPYMDGVGWDIPDSRPWFRRLVWRGVRQQGCTWEKEDVNEEECPCAFVVIFPFKWPQSITLGCFLPSLILFLTLFTMSAPTPHQQAFGLNNVDNYQII